MSGTCWACGSEAAHFPDVLLVMRAVDDRARAEEEERLEEGVREEVIHRRVVRGEADGAHHVAELREGRVSEDALDVVLLDGDQRGPTAVVMPMKAMTSCAPGDAATRKKTRESM